MTTIQRRRGQPVVVYGTIEVTDFRDQKVLRPDLDNPHAMKGWAIPDRSSRAEVPGQQEIDVVKIGIDYPLPEGVPPVDLWSRVDWGGSSWDVAAPPDQRFGTRATRHQTVTLRRRTVQGA